MEARRNSFGGGGGSLLVRSIVESMKERDDRKYEIIAGKRRRKPIRFRERGDCV